MESCHTVYGIAGTYCQMRHLDLSVINDRHLAYLFMIAGILRLDLCDEATVDLLHNLINTRQQS